MSQQENNNLQDDTAPAQGIGVGGYMAAGAEATPSPKTSVHEPVLIVFGFVLAIVLMGVTHGAASSLASALHPVGDHWKNTIIVSDWIGISFFAVMTFLKSVQFFLVPSGSSRMSTSFSVLKASARGYVKRLFTLWLYITFCWKEEYLMLLTCLVSAAMFVLFVAAYKLFTSLEVAGYEPAISVGLMLISGLFLIGIFAALPVSLMDCLVPAVAYVLGAWVYVFVRLRREGQRDG